MGLPNLGSARKTKLSYFKMSNMAVEISLTDTVNWGKSAIKINKCLAKDNGLLLEKGYGTIDFVLRFGMYLLTRGDRPVRNFISRIPPNLKKYMEIQKLKIFIFTRQETLPYKWSFIYY